MSRCGGTVCACGRGAPTIVVKFATVALAGAIVAVVVPVPLLSLTAASEYIAILLRNEEFISTESRANLSLDKHVFTLEYGTF